MKNWRNFSSFRKKKINEKTFSKLQCWKILILRVFFRDHYLHFISHHWIRPNLIWPPLWPKFGGLWRFCHFYRKRLIFPYLLTLSVRQVKLFFGSHPFTSPDDNIIPDKTGAESKLFIWDHAKGFCSFVYSVNHFSHFWQETDRPVEEFILICFGSMMKSAFLHLVGK